jgi:hypothetical protein
VGAASMLWMRYIAEMSLAGCGIGEETIVGVTITRVVRQTVDQFMAALVHPHAAAVQSLRAAILAGSQDISESVKWNAPNFRAYGQDRVTLRLQPGDRLELIFHRGAAKRDDAATFVFDDASGLVRWVTPDRGVIVLSGGEDAHSKQSAIVELVKSWIQV